MAEKCLPESKRLTNKQACALSLYRPVISDSLCARGTGVGATRERHKYDFQSSTLKPGTIIFPLLAHLSCLALR